MAFQHPPLHRDRGLLGLSTLEREPRTCTNGLLPSTASSDSNQSLRLKGTTEAVYKRAIQTPLLAGEKSGMLTIVKLTPAGTLVKCGDILVEFDRQDQLRDFINGDAGRHHLHFGYAAYLVPALAARATV